VSATTISAGTLVLSSGAIASGGSISFTSRVRHFLARLNQPVQITSRLQHCRIFPQWAISCRATSGNWGSDPDL
jgi:hypothetical protein